MNIARLKYYANNSYEFLSSAIEIIADEKLQRYKIAFIFNCIENSISQCHHHRDTGVSQRHCRFNSESNLTHFSIYTRGLCLQECRLKLVYKLCGCIPHFYPNQSKLFNLIRLMCD